MNEKFACSFGAFLARYILIFKLFCRTPYALLVPRGDYFYALKRIPKVVHSGACLCNGSKVAVVHCLVGGWGLLLEPGICYATNANAKRHIFASNDLAHSTIRDRNSRPRLRCPPHVSVHKSKGARIDSGTRAINKDVPVVSQRQNEADAVVALGADGGGEDGPRAYDRVKQGAGVSLRLKKAIVSYNMKGCRHLYLYQIFALSVFITEVV